jgi:hypothetical protein
MSIATPTPASPAAGAPVARSLQLGLALVLVLGCPTAVDVAALEPAPRSEPLLDENDPRVVRDGVDLYAAEVIEKREQRELADEPEAPALGSGKPDESNGVCRLYAPELPKPECCEGEYGFDAEQLQKSCGFDLYLGESFQYTCGYFFHSAGKLPSWFRMSYVAGDDPAAAADTHDRKLQRASKNDALRSTPVPGVDGALWSGHDGLRWAFLPGWKRVRQLSWRDRECSDEVMAKVIAQIVAAAEPPAGAKRTGLIPKSRS